MDVHINNAPVNGSYSDEYKKDDGKSWTITPSNDSCDHYEFVIKDKTTGVSSNPIVGKQCKINKSSNTDKEIYSVTISCLKKNGDRQTAVDDSEVTVDLTPKLEGDGRAIFDFTAHTDTHSITTNMSFTNFAGDSTAPECEYQQHSAMTGNCIEGAETEVLVDENDTLNLYKGKQDNTHRENLRDNSDTRLTYFNKNKPWFDVERLRIAADWLQKNKLLTVSLPDETKGAGATVDNPVTGTMTMRQFLRNVAADQTMYGVVRVLVGFEKDAKTGKIQHCSTTNDSGVCDCATDDLDEEHYNAEPHNGTYKAKIGDMICHRFEEIEAEIEDHDNDMRPDTLCGLNVTANSIIKVKGSLFFDYVYEDNGGIHPVELNVNDGEDDDIEEIDIGMPILVNWDDGLTQNQNPVVEGNGTLNPAIAQAIKAISVGNTVDETKISFDNVPQSALDAYNYYQHDKNPDFTYITTPGEFRAQPVSAQYHMLMPTGYAKSWADAFNKLHITAAEWENIMSDSGSNLPEFKAPTNTTNTTWTADQFRTETFEDIPAFLYAGGFINIKTNKIFIAGLTYIPQAFTLEVGGDELYPGVTATSYFSGAVMVRDGFFIQARKDGLLLMSSDPSAYSKVLTNGGRIPELSVSHSPGVFASNNSGGSGAPPAGYGGLGVQKQVSPPLWVEIRPQ